MPIAVEKLLIDRTFCLGINPAMRGVKRALPPHDALTFVMKPSCDFQRLDMRTRQPKRGRPFGYDLLYSTAMLREKLRIGRERAEVVASRWSSPLINDEPSQL